MASALQIIEEELDKFLALTKPCEDKLGKAVVTTYALTELGKTIKQRVREECGENDDGHPCLNCQEMIGSPDSCCSVECDEEYAGKLETARTFKCTYHRDMAKRGSQKQADQEAERCYGCSLVRSAAIVRGGNPICPHGTDLRDETCSECGLNVEFPQA